MIFIDTTGKANITPEKKKTDKKSHNKGEIFRMIFEREVKRNERNK